MKVLKLKSNFNYFQIEEKSDFFERDFTQFSSSFTPGEWIRIDAGNESYIAQVNPFFEGGPVVKILDRFDQDKKDLDQLSYAKLYLKEKIEKAFNYRKNFFPDKNNFRLVYGSADGLNGLVVDLYKNCAIVQCNTAGMDVHRELIRQYVQEITQTQVFFINKTLQRKKENLPQNDTEQLPEFILVEENDFVLKIPGPLAQKAGYYYDHRNNRAKLENFINKKGCRKGLDIFCYMGSWGLHLLRSGVEDVVFIDQGPYADIVKNNILSNQLKGKYEFIQGDAFKEIENLILKGVKFDVIVSDPPAFAKSQKDQDAAINGYQKLHNKIFSLLNPDSYLVVASCTQQVDFYQLDRTVQMASQNHRRKVRILDSGIQGADHPITSLTSKNLYIKYILYYVH